MRVPAIAFALVFVATPAFAETFEVVAKRESSNLYSLDRGRAYAITRLCHVYAYSDEAVVEWSGSRGTIHFKDDDEDCDIRKLLVRTTLGEGTYRVQVSREGDGFFSMNFGSTYLRAPFCFEFPFGEEAFLIWNGFSGTLKLKNPDRACDVDGVWGLVR